MREIKFRAWDKKSKKIREVISIIYTNKSFDYMSYKTFNEIKLVYLKGRDIIDDKDIQISRKENEFKLMQYTGIKDENGVEVYEGDIVKVSGTAENNDLIYRMCEVVFNEGSYVFKFQKDFYFYHNSIFEVIGNIYENSELLKD